ncbi:hypothetical protein EVAR_100778_1 [Eumeta japonica]|uniref:Uncharacterized protein n=1 Tax=Eumeta variegata TaxID=151549 RepID=A0A4C2AAH6_EUMVA|nr:hypothetical protein EVAR_100778_1 [Eumeta japonica]
MGLLARTLGRTLMQGLQTSAGRSIHTTAAVNSDPGVHGGNRTTCTLIPGMVLALNWFMLYKRFSRRNDREAMRGGGISSRVVLGKSDPLSILATPDYSVAGELQTLNMKLRNELDLYANVVHVRSFTWC